MPASNMLAITDQQLVALCQAEVDKTKEIITLINKDKQETRVVQHQQQQQQQQPARCCTIIQF